MLMKLTIVANFSLLFIRLVNRSNLSKVSFNGTGTSHASYLGRSIENHRDKSKSRRKKKSPGFYFLLAIV